MRRRSTYRRPRTALERALDGRLTSLEFTAMLVFLAAGTTLLGWISR